jgi:hypothetical protein
MVIARGLTDRNGPKQVLINSCESGRKAKRQNLRDPCDCDRKQHRSPFDALFLANAEPNGDNIVRYD